MTFHNNKGTVVEHSTLVVSSTCLPNHGHWHTYRTASESYAEWYMDTAHTDLYT